ncbi:MAG: hypothetical protein K2X01_03325 [Cyanobacteria bacterium]|nr:hypothetical protein [Cyanobacteriota bacterium]
MLRISPYTASVNPSRSLQAKFAGGTALPDPDAIANTTIGKLLDNAYGSKHIDVASFVETELKGKGIPTDARTHGVILGYIGDYRLGDMGQRIKAAVAALTEE